MQIAVLERYRAIYNHMIIHINVHHYFKIVAFINNYKITKPNETTSHEITGYL